MRLLALLTVDLAVLTNSPFFMNVYNLFNTLPHLSILATEGARGRKRKVAIVIVQHFQVY